jgi:ceramide glucosyltransferase
MGALLVALAAAYLVFHLLSVALFLRRLGQGQPERSLLGRPRLTLLRPVCGRDAHDAETLASSLSQDYPDYEVVFCVERADDPVLPLIEALLAQDARVPARLLVGRHSVTGNPKLDNLWKGWQDIDRDWVCVTDSNLLLPPDYLATVVDAWGPDTGVVSAPPAGIRPEGWAARVECAFLNSNQARLQCLADSAGLGFAQGKTLFFNKPLLDAQGGLAALGRTLAEDVAATKVTRALGARVSLAPLPFPQPIGRRRLSQVLGRQLRWSRVRRDGFPLLFALEPLNGALLPVAAAAAATVMAGATPLLAVAYLAVWYGAEAVLMRRAGWPSGWRDVAVLPLRDLLLPALWIASFRHRGFVWRGNAMGDASPAPSRTSSGAPSGQPVAAE